MADTDENMFQNLTEKRTVAETGNGLSAQFADADRIS